MKNAEVQALIEQRDGINKELKEHALKELKQVALIYNAAWGDDKGVFMLGEQLLTHVAPSLLGNDGWANLVSHLRKISG
ncbi:hypothetical protein WDX82_005122 [Salmonella enterica]